MFLGLQVCQPASAGPLFKCEVNGRIEFSDRRCQPAKATCSQREGSEEQHGQCARSAPEAGRSTVHPQAPQSHPGNSMGLPGRLAFNDRARDAESKLPVSDSRFAGASLLAEGGIAANERRR
jgi:hypothetical protein